MKAVFVDCTPEMRNVLTSTAQVIPPSVQIHEGNPTNQELITLCKDADVLLVEHTVISPDVLAACTKLQTIVFMGTGASTYLPMDDAARRGVKVITIPGYANRAVAEHAMALTFAAARHIATMDREVRAGVWAPRGGFELRGRKVAVIGLGNIGTEYANMALALGMHVAGWSQAPRSEPYFVSDLDEALRDAQIASLHLALSGATRGLLNSHRLGLLRPGAILVNTARSQLVDLDALRNALTTGQIGHAAMDVFDEEPLQAGHEWAAHLNVTLTPHAAYMTTEAYLELWRRTMDALRGVEQTFQTRPNR